MFTRYALSMAAVLLLASCAMTPAQPVATAPPHDSAAASPAPVASAPPPLAPAAPAEPATVPEHAAAPPAATSGVVPPRPPVVSTPAPASAPPPPTAASHPIAAPVATMHAQRRIVALTRHPADHRTARPSRPARSETAERNTASTGSLRGHVTLNAGSGQHIAAGDLAETLVYFVPKSGNVAPPPGAFTVFTQKRAYDPAAMAIPLGSTVTFANLDEVRHNEFSVTPGSAFNLGYQVPGEKTAHVFAHAGLVLVGCLVHRVMELDVLVVPTTFVTRASTDGNFNLHDLPPGPGTLYVWNPRGRLSTRPLAVPAASPVEVRLELVKPKQSAQIEVPTQP